MSTPRSIPTIYAGIQFRSRFEAEFAQTLDRWSIDWEYEPVSFLLENGQHFWPDFRLPILKVWIELRGYVTEHGEAQIEQFARQLSVGESLIVFRANGDREFFYGPALPPGSPRRGREFKKELKLFTAASAEFDDLRGTPTNTIIRQERE